MTNHEAIRQLKAYHPEDRYKQLREAVHTAISALEPTIPSIVFYEIYVEEKNDESRSD